MQLKNKNLGLTLIELLVVLTIIALVGAVVGPRVLNTLGGAQTKTTKLQIDDFGAALDLFYLDTGRYPSSGEGLQALVAAPAGSEDWNGPYLKKKRMPRDPWQQDYIYVSPGTHNTNEFDLSSYGPDEVESDDDITNWGLLEDN